MLNADGFVNYPSTFTQPSLHETPINTGLLSLKVKVALAPILLQFPDLNARQEGFACFCQQFDVYAVAVILYDIANLVGLHVSPLGCRRE